MQVVDVELQKPTNLVESNISSPSADNADSVASSSSPPSQLHTEDPHAFDIKSSIPAKRPKLESRPIKLEGFEGFSRPPADDDDFDISFLCKPSSIRTPSKK